MFKIIMKNNLGHGYTQLDWFVVLAIFMFPVTFLTVRHGVHFSLFALLLMAINQSWRVKIKNIQFNDPRDFLILLTFSGLFFSVLLSQIFRGAIDFSAFDGPSRILIAGLVFLLLKQLNVAYIKVLSVAIPTGLICIFCELKMNPSVYWDNRFATYFVDPNTLGAQSFALGIVSFLMIGLGRSDSKILLLLQVLGGALGLYISIGSGSRGAWLTLPFILFLMLYLRVGDISLAEQSKKSQMRIQTMVIFISILAALFIGLLCSEMLSSRIINGYFDIHNWVGGSNLEGSAGVRLSIWKFSFQFANERLLFGYGEEKNMMQVLQGSPLNSLANQTAIKTMALAGPHSDILSKLLATGIFGLIAYLCLLFVPLYFFWIHRNELNASKKLASRIGLYYIVGIFIAGLSNEQLSLKYLCTFYGLMIATLLAQVLHQPSNRQTKLLHE